MTRSLIAIVFAASSFAALTGIVVAQGLAAKDVLPPGSVSRAEGLEAWKRIEAVVTHPRCANCHVDSKAIPIWTPAGESRNRVHGMNIHGGQSRIGAETIGCSTCHMTSTLPNDPHQRRCAPASTGNLPRWISSGSEKVAPRFVRNSGIPNATAVATPSVSLSTCGTMHR
jgi:hypothetical protein